MAFLACFLVLWITGSMEICMVYSHKLGRRNTCRSRTVLLDCRNQLVLRAKKFILPVFSVRPF